MIRLENVYKSYSGSTGPWVLEDLSLGIGAREMVFLLGASGAGKSTLLKLVTLEERPTKGKIKVHHFDSSLVKERQVPELRRRCGVVYQDFRLIRDKTVQENVAYVLKMTGILDPDVIRNESHRVLDLVGLYAKRHQFPTTLSGGEQQRCAIARALVHQPSIVLADEPTGNLDPAMGAEIFEILRRVNVAGATVLVATHDQDLARRFADRIVVLEQGKLRREETPRARRSVELGELGPVR
ncbi:MAG: ATP-binding cassette domain-containing protein [Candidatus Eisenbacteria bacterium]|nr:ATP-binding cassette domain-containing protein [Candidatus Eisenbacteria bacterium]MCC7144195.1 ATP-binding cassette domain-containing protein [Candidatus Eisenbacteria bacterium]